MVGEDEVCELVREEDGELRCLSRGGGGVRGVVCGVRVRG